uniref:Uncharacterized protein n=1 Tax=Marseillevirus LCMAC103 TaxID=2506604 RepID=A0A481YWB2_9VIRU|nr:MAG: hypothetical protein LCMAC103_04090 [Marseillevirus LCMAC103]
MAQLVLVRAHALDNCDENSHDEVYELVMEDLLFQSLLGRAKNADTWLTTCVSTVSEWKQCLEKKSAAYDGLALDTHWKDWKYRVSIAVTYTHNKKLIDAFLLLRPPSRDDARVRACDPAPDRFFELFED